MRARVRGAVAVGAVMATVVLSLAGSGGAAASVRAGRVASQLGSVSNSGLPPGWFEVGAAKEDITPRSLTGVYLGGYGFGPMHPAKGVLRHIYARAIAIRDRAGTQVAIAAIDVQGEFIAYRQGPYGFANMAATLHRQLGIPVTHLLFQSTHTHNGPDDVGFWGGVPTSYLAFVARQTERAVRTAVARERPARLRWATAAMPGFTGTFGRTVSDPRGDTKDFPVDQTLRVLQAVSAGGKVTATLVDFAAHATVYGPLDKVSPDWPGATATYLEHDEIGMPRHLRYGYPGSVSVVVEGDLGRTWPAGIPRYNDPRLNPPKATDDNYPADAYGNAIARAAIAGLKHARWLRGGVSGKKTSIDVANDNPILLGAIADPAPAVQVYRSVLPPYGFGDVLTTTVAALRIGSLLVAGAPGEEYPSVEAALRRDVRVAAVLPMSLADDQLGYLGTPGDYAAAQECSTTDEGFFTISPLFGDEALQAQRLDAEALGFRVTGRTGLADAGTVPPTAVCLSSQLP